MRRSGHGEGGGQGGLDGLSGRITWRRASEISRPAAAATSAAVPLLPHLAMALSNAGVGSSWSGARRSPAAESKGGATRGAI